MRKQHPLTEKREKNEENAGRFGRRTTKASRRAARRERMLVRETAWLTSVGVDPAEAGVPVG